jgi:SAM-dependent MidA family methyltransferase
MTLLQGNNANEMFRIPAKVEKLSDFSNRINKSTPRFISPDSTSRVANNSYPKVDSIRHPDHNHKEHHTFEEGDGLEMSPLSIAICEDIAKRVVRSGGAALLVDYGEDFTQEDSLRGFRRHGQVSILSEVSCMHDRLNYVRLTCFFAAWSSGRHCRRGFFSVCSSCVQ